MRFRQTRFAGAWLAWALAVLAGSAEAQWVETPGRGGADLTVCHLNTRQVFDIDGRVIDFFADGHAVTTSAFLTVAAGVLPGVDAWLQVPYQRLDYEVAPGTLSVGARLALAGKNLPAGTSLVLGYFSRWPL